MRLRGLKGSPNPQTSHTVRHSGGSNHGDEGKAQPWRLREIHPRALQVPEVPTPGWAFPRCSGRPSKPHRTVWTPASLLPSEVLEVTHRRKVAVNPSWAPSQEKNASWPVFPDSSDVQMCPHISLHHEVGSSPPCEDRCQMASSREGRGWEHCDVAPTRGDSPKADQPQGKARLEEVSTGKHWPGLGETDTQRCAVPWNTHCH